MSKIRWLLGTLALMSTFAYAAWPEKAVRYVIPFPPGGESDIAARFQQIKFKQEFGQELIVESNVGAGGALAWAQLNGMTGDGYAIMGINLPPALLAQRKKDYVDIARKMGLMK